MTNKTTPLQQVREALETAKEFIGNGLELGYIIPCENTTVREDINQALLTLQGKVIVDEGRLMEVITEKCTDEIKDRIMDDFNKSANARQAVDATLAYLTKEDSDELN